MPILSDSDFKKYRKILKFKPMLKETGPSSQDLHIGQVYLPPKIPQDRKSMEEILDSPAVEFVKKLDKMPMKTRGSDNFWYLEPKGYYLATTVETVTLPEQFNIDVDSRSSWARLGLRVSHADDDLNSHRKNFVGKILLMLSVQDKPILLRPKDRICQAAVYDYLNPLGNSELLDVLRAGDIGCYKAMPTNQGVAKAPIWNIANSSILLTLSEDIKKFVGHEIDPKADNSQSYRTINIARGCDVGNNRFYLGSSNETTCIGSKYVGMLREIFDAPQRARVHANAGFIDPGFEGTITLEQYIPSPLLSIIFPNMQMGELEIHELLSPCEKPYKSKYSGQHGTTISRAHLDYNTQKGRSK